MKQRVHHHASVAVVLSERSKEFLFDRYTETYRIPAWRGRLNLIGGGQSSEDSSPWDIWEREVTEEFHETIAKNLITNAKPYKDFLVTVPEVMEIQNGRIQRRKGFIVVHTVFETFLDQEIFEQVRNHLKEGKKVKTEGSSVIKSLKDLGREEIQFASATGPIMKDYLDRPDVKVSAGSQGMVVTPLGMPRDSLEEYFSDFEYEWDLGDEEVQGNSF